LRFGLLPDSAYVLPRVLPHVLPYVLQFLLVCAGMIAWTILIEEGIGWDELKGSPLGNVGFQIAKAAGMGLVSLILGVAVQRIAPSNVSARWVWALPLSVLSLTIGWDAVRGFGIGWGLSNYFFCAHPGRDESCVARDLFTYPAWSCGWYSVGAMFASRRN
jgi:hypothetical protein